MQSETNQDMPVIAIKLFMLFCTVIALVVFGIYVYKAVYLPIKRMKKREEVRKRKRYVQVDEEVFSGTIMQSEETLNLN